MSRSEEFYGANDIERMFPDQMPITTVPWSQMSRRKDRGDYNKNLVADELRKPPSEVTLHPVDTRGLHASQPMVLREHVQHYLSGEYERTGRTSADQELTGNQHPVVYRRAGLGGGPTQDLLLSGHHRAAAALLQGRELHARLIEGGWGPTRGQGPPSLVRKEPKLRKI